MKKSSIVGTGHKWKKLVDKKSQLTCPEEHPLVIAFSGGRTSGMMLRHYLDTEEQQPIVLFANTGKERDETLDFVHEVEVQWGIPVVWLEFAIVPIDFELIKTIPSAASRKHLVTKKDMFWYRQVDYATASRHQNEQTPFDELLSTMTVLPDARMRLCTKELKIKTMQRYLWSQRIYKFRNAVGFRADEPDRVVELIYGVRDAKNTYLEFPLARKGVIEEDVNDFWSSQKFDLRLKPHESNCHLCFLKKKRALISLIASNPELAEWWSAQEKTKEKTRSKNRHEQPYFQWNARTSVQELIEQATNYEFREDDTRNAMQCACTSAMSLSTEDKEAEEDATTDRKNPRPQPRPKANSRPRPPAQKKRPIPKKKQNPPAR
jgi:3'-phosphoadenosine 5'-phosphosulfate sulfotransferase (PAPS reductase)/FAD synthetase